MRSVYNISGRDLSSHLMAGILLIIHSMAKRVGAILIILIGLSNFARGATYYTRVSSGNWSSPSTWSTSGCGGGASATIPGAGDNVQICNGAAITVNGTYSCATLTINSGNTISSVIITLNNSLTVSGATVITSSSNADYKYIQVAGNFTTASLTTNSGGNTQDAFLEITSGTATVTGNIVMNAADARRNYILFSGDGTLEIGGGFTVNGYITSAAGGATSAPTSGTVNYNSSGAQTVSGFTYYNLTLSGAGAKTISGSTVNNVLSMEGTATASAAPTYGASATLQYNTTTARSAGPEWLNTFAATGGVVVKNTGVITLNAAKVFNQGIPLNIDVGSTLNTSAANNYGLTFGGDFINAGTLAANASPVIITSAAAAQSIGGFTTTGNVSMTKTGGIATFTGNLNANGLTINGNGSTLDLGTGLTHTLTGSWTNTNGIVNGGSSQLIIGNNVTFTGGSFMSGTGSVTYNANGAQNVAGVIYNDLNISGSATKTLAGAATVEGTLTLSGGTLAVAANTLTLNGPPIAGSPNNLVTTASSTLVFGGSSGGITVPLSVTTLNNLTVSNPSGVTLTAPLSSGTLTFTDGILNTTSTNLLTITNTAAGSIGGASSTSFVNGPMARTLLAGQTNYVTPYLFPVGTGADYRPLELLNITTGATTPVILVSQSATGALTSDETTITSVAPRNWYVQRLSGNFTGANVRLTENGLNFSNVIGQSAAQSGNYVSVGGKNIGTSITTASPVVNASLPAYFAIGTTLVTTYYSYQSGDWNSSGTWTIDPSGSLWIGAAVPGAADNVVILNGRTVTISQNSKSSLSLDIKLGGNLDLQGTNSHNFGTVSGQGTLKLSSGTFPGGLFTGFVAADGGTVEYYNLNNTGISSTQLTYNNLIISNYTAGATSVFLNNATNPINYTLNGNFDLKNNTSGSLTFYFGNSTPSDNLINMIVNGSISIGAGCNIRVNNFASSHTLPNPGNTTSTFPIHSLSVYGDFTNNGTVRFTGLPSPFNNAYYTLGVTAYSGTNYGDVQVFFKGAADNTLTCNGITDFFRLIVQKGTDQTNKLEVISSNANNFALYGPNNQGNNNAGGGFCWRLWLRGLL